MGFLAALRISSGFKFLPPRAGRESASAHTIKEQSWLNKSQLTETLAKAENITLKKGEMVIKAVFENMANLVEKKRIEIRGFESFKVKFCNGYKRRQ